MSHFERILTDMPNWSNADLCSEYSHAMRLADETSGADGEAFMQRAELARTLLVERLRVAAERGSPEWAPLRRAMIEAFNWRETQ